MILGDLDELKEVIKANHYLLSAKNNSTDYGMFTTGIMQAIDSAPTVVNEYTKGFADGERSGRHLPLTDEEKAILVRQWRPQGDWIECTKSGMPLTEYGRMTGEKWYGFKCSRCKFIYKGNALVESPFCQKCGADMLKGGEE